MKKKSGFTLLELVITVAVLSIVTAIAIPSMTTFTQNDRLTTQINTLVGHLAYARSEAVLRSQQVSVCVSNDATTCSGGTAWNQGWIVYVDLNGGGTFDAGETILRAKQALEGNNTLTPTNIGSQVTYDYRGFTNNLAAGSFLLCDSRSGNFGKLLSITITGRVRTQKDQTCP